MCAKPGRLNQAGCITPDEILAALVASFEQLRSSGCTAECDRLRRQIESLAIVCPTHAPTLMANAVIAYDDQRIPVAQQFLDQILTQQGPHADAAALRARIAIDEGNLPFARRMLTEHLVLAPDHAALHETLAAVLFLVHDLTAAEQELTTALALGAPEWRIAYHRGLVAEAAGRIDQAIDYFTQAVAGNPSWTAAQARLNFLRAKKPPG